ncbi:MAG: NADH dehydrogenase [Acidobacteria bacterium RIFCSPLOWO2_12_FULL_54_10]|nr:MAG: NADH dehydrogenase [Acidobacteria bacterium RIFCSPLOWO2_12_FULL_54_10]
MEPWDSEVVQSLRKSFPGVDLEAFSFRGQNLIIVPRESILPVAHFFKSELKFDFLSDLTAADYPQKEKRFEVVYQLYSFKRNERVRLKVPVGETESLESVVPVWITADWMEREVYDMFGIHFDHHPNLKRILLPDEWQGFPLRKDYGILQQDVKWVQENLHIQSGQ